MVGALEERGAEVFRLNTAWFPGQVRVAAELDDGRWRGVVHTPHGCLELEAVHAVWYRSPEAYRMPTQLTAAEAQHARVEAKYGLGGVLASLPAVCWHRFRRCGATIRAAWRTPRTSRSNSSARRVAVSPYRGR
ncbi:MvdC/MvdD family ATP grasp protein [Kutzneria sp. 744]|uniref:MvdC/MvdD family ATP grasp protein n=1 Tax=Kutzneria sp. (strain 744) TaxID=345341 RepID=UPI00350ECBEC